MKNFKHALQNCLFQNTRRALGVRVGPDSASPANEGRSATGRAGILSCALLAWAFGLGAQTALCSERFPAPVYPEGANRARLAGSVRLTVAVEKGRVGSVKIVSQAFYETRRKTSDETPVVRAIEGYPNIFENAIAEALRKWRLPDDVDSFDLEIVFALTDRELDGGEAVCEEIVYQSIGDSHARAPKRITLTADRIGPDIIVDYEIKRPSAGSR